MFFAMHEYALRGRVIAPSMVLYIDSPSRPKTLLQGYRTEDARPRRA